MTVNKKWIHTAKACTKLTEHFYQQRDGINCLASKHGFWSEPSNRKRFATPLKRIIKYNKTPSFGLNGQLSVALFTVARPVEYLSTPRPMDHELARMTSLQSTVFTPGENN